MFVFTDAANEEVIVRERRYTTDAQAGWPFLTHFNASALNYARQLVTMVKERCSFLQTDADAEISDWTLGKVF